MNKKEFIADLEKRLKYISEEDRKDAIGYYSEYLCDMNLSDDEDVCKRIGKPKDIAAGILAECTEKMISEKKENKNGNAWRIVLLALIIAVSIPILIPLVIAIFILMICFLAIASTFVVVGVFCMISAVLINGIAQKLVCLGTALILLALGILSFIGVYELGRLLVHLIVNLSKKTVKKEKINEKGN